VRIAAGIAGLLLLAIVLGDAFETVVLPRRINRRLRLTRLFYRATWHPFAAGARFIRNPSRREAYLSLYGPLSLLFLLGPWAAGLIVAFGLLHYAVGSAVTLAAAGATTGRPRPGTRPERRARSIARVSPRFIHRHVTVAY
jgi:hypothetical protein